MSSSDISNADDMIDSRDVIQRIAELEDERDALRDEVEQAVMAHEDHPTEHTKDYAEAAQVALDAWLADCDTGIALRDLLALQSEAEVYAPDWMHGATLVRDSYFERFAQQLAEDLGQLPEDTWPLSCIDWEQAARELQADYTSVEYGGVTYWVR